VVKKILDSQVVGLAPWIVFSLLSGPDRLEESVLLALGAAVVIYVANRVEGESFKALELSDIVYFSALAVFVALSRSSTHEWLETWADEISNISMVLIATGSLLVRRPFTRPYARDRVNPSMWNDANFIRTNYVISGAWAAAFAVAAISGAYGDGVLHDSENLWTGWIIQTVVLIWAARFTAWYSDRARVIGRRAAGVAADEPPSVTELVKSFSGYNSVSGLLHVRRGNGRQ
jgi:hypothetical protein